MGQNGRGIGHVTNFWILGPLLSLDRLKLQTSNFAGGLKLRGTRQRNKNGQSGRCPWHVTRCCSLEPIIIRWPTRLPTVSLLTSWTKKGENIKLIISLTLQCNGLVFLSYVENIKNHKRWYYFAAQWHFGNVLRCNTIFCDFCCFLRMIKN